MGSEKVNEHNVMYIYHKQCEIMQIFNERAQTANFTDFPTTPVPDTVSHSIIIYREGLDLTLSILPCLQGRII